MPAKSIDVTKSCTACGNDVTRPAWKMKSDRVFCNRDCSGKYGLRRGTATERKAPTRRSKFVNIGQEFGELVVTAVDIYIPKSGASPGHPGNRAAVCECSCGNIVKISIHALLNGNTKSCGCYKAKVARASMNALQVSKGAALHGLSSHSSYHRWCDMMIRCYKETHKFYPRYGGRGIEVYAPWQDVKVFLNWVDDNLGECPAGYSLDRIDNSGNYEPGNIRWADASTQMGNRG